MEDTSKISSSDANQTWRSLDQFVKSTDEDRWISSRYADKDKRLGLISLYAFNVELAKIPKSVSEELIRSIRFQWWRDVLGELQNEENSLRHDVVWGLRQSLNIGALSTETLLKLLEDHAESSGQSEVRVMSQAASMLSEHHGWSDYISQIALNYADSRSNDVQEVYNVHEKVPIAIRPAVNHAVLRHRYARNKTTSSLRKRFIICKSILTGYI